MPTLRDYYDWSQEPDIWQRVAAASVLVAITVMAEADTVPGHAQRVTLAQKVLEDPRTWGRLIALGLLVSNEPASKTVTDNALTAAVTAVWNAYAGVG